MTHCVIAKAEQVDDSLIVVVFVHPRFAVFKN